jgi:hypothetical protein
MKRLMLCMGIALACVSAATAGATDRARIWDTHGAQTWSAWGGTIGVHWNADLLANLGVSVAQSAQTIAAPKTGGHADFRPHTWFAVRQAGGLDFAVTNGTLRSFSGGSLTMDGGFVLKLRDGSTIDLRNAVLRVRATDPNVLDVVSADGKVWFFSDRIMFQLVDNERSLAIRAADLRIAPALAQRLGVRDSSGWEIADMALNTQVYIQGVDEQPTEACSPYPWPDVAVPGEPGQVYQADLFMKSLTVSPVGCQTCTGPTGTGIASFAPSSTLRNNVNDGSVQQTINDPIGTSSALHTGFVAWHTMFSGNSAPYNNDQHPFLIWNLYRFNANGGISQVGRSGVKHAFVTTNGGCLDACNHLGGAALGRGCSDTYGTGNNDSTGDMGPRSEIIPATGQWGRCGSIFDTNCDGNENSNGNTAWTQRMKVPETKLAHTTGDGSSYVFESWYIAREDINIYNSMATMSVNPQFSGSQWSLSGATNYLLGSGIDRWVDPVSPPANAKNTEVATAEGHAKVAVKVTDLGDGKWRYNYAVMNFDFARAVTQGAEPNLRVVSNKGFDAFSVPIPAGAKIQATGSDLGDPDPNVAWRSTIADGQLSWSNNTALPVFGGHTTPPQATLPTLDWGTLYSFTFIASAPPVMGSVTLHVAETGSPQSFAVATLVPAGSAR